MKQILKLFSEDNNNASLLLVILLTGSFVSLVWYLSNRKLKNLEITEERKQWVHKHFFKNGIGSILFILKSKV